MSILQESSTFQFTLKRFLHHTGASFIPARLHPGSVMSLYIQLHDTNLNFILEQVIPERVHPGGRTGSKFSFWIEIWPNVPKVSYKGDMELGTWIDQADQLTHVFDPLMFLSHFHSRIRTSM